jgi:hypothetical protein
MCVLFAALFQLEPSSFAFRTFSFFPPKERHNVGLLRFDDDHDHICYRLRRFKYLAEKKNHYKFKFEDETWLNRVTYLADIFSCLNETNASVQDSACSVFTVQDKIQAFIKKLSLTKNLMRLGAKMRTVLDKHVSNALNVKFIYA